MTNVCSQSRSVRTQNNDCTWISSSDKVTSPPPNVLSLNNRPPAAVFFTGTYVMVMGVIQAVSPEPVIRAVKMADLSELAALHRRMWKLEVEELQRLLAWMQRAAGGNAASAWQQDDPLLSRVSGWVCTVPTDSWQMGKKLCRRTEQQQQRHNLRGCQACDREAWCKSDKDSDTRKQYLHCDVWRLNNTSYFPCGPCSYSSGAAGLTTGFINVFIPSCLQCFASGQSLTHNENISYPAKDIISPTTVLKGPVHNKLRKHFPLFCCAIYESANKEDLNSSVFPEMMTWLCFLSPSTHRGKHVRHEHESRDTERKLKTAHDKVCGWSLITSSWHL